ncbi:N-acetylmuramoyl-L-alanine amidase [Psychromonas aquimarina]|uniref:N-acetylmuramoyl-L-alanine amidase n=1 Tax=Psychromonas aquimarina TaxID=444919 RepID=UPI00040EFD7D|nr:N-acetylmuramoyl-L-alanine amidase [Psychromonas aquimarina]
MNKYIVIACAFFSLNAVSEELCLNLNAGHGGRDGGFMRDSILESQFVLEVAKQLEPLLEAQGIEVNNVRSADDYISLDERVDIVSNAPDCMLINLHAEPGSEGVYYKGDENRDFAKSIKDNLSVYIKQPLAFKEKAYRELYGKKAVYINLPLGDNSSPKSMAGALYKSVLRAI